MKNALRTDARREIRFTLSRFLSILVLSALSVAFLAGLRTTAPDMELSADAYFDGRGLMDLRVVSTLGVTEDDISFLAALPEISAAEGAYTADAICRAGGQDRIVKVLSLSAAGLNAPRLTSGRMPEAETECLAETGFFAHAGLSLGDSIALDTGTGSFEDALRHSAFTIVGTADSPLYIHVDRGTSSLGTGKVDAFFLLPPAAFSMDYFTDSYLSVTGASELLCYGQEYKDLISGLIDRMEPLGDGRAGARYDEVIGEATETLDDAQAEFDDAEREAEEKLSDALGELEDARKKLDDGWAEYEDGLDTLARETRDGARKLSDALADLEQGELDYTDGMAELADGRAEYEDGLLSWEEGKAEYDDGLQSLLEGEAEYEDGLLEFRDGERKYLDGLAEYRDGVKEWEDGARELEKARNQLADAADLLFAGSSALSSGREQLRAGEAAYQQLVGGVQMVSGLNPLEPYQPLSEQEAAAIADFLENNVLPQLAGDPAEEAALLQLIAYLRYNHLDPQNPPTMMAPVTALLAQQRAQLDAAQAQLEDSANSLDFGWAEYEMGLQKLREGEAEFSDGAKELRDAYAELEDARRELDDGRAELDDGRAELDDGWAGLQDAKDALDEGLLELEDARRKLEDGEAELPDARRKLDDGWAEYEDGQAEFAEETAKARRELADAYIELTDGEAEYRDGLIEYEDGKREADEKLSDARRELNDARRKLGDITDCKWYILGREVNLGYVSFQQDAERMGNLSSVFPLIFFLVAALVCLTTMTRMVEEQRVQIGGMKALGFGKGAIAGKYVGYGLFASLFGGLLGLALGCTVIPLIIYTAWQILYTLGPLVFAWKPVTYALSLFSAVLIVSGAAFSACCSALASVPAGLMRPKAPPPGKRVLLERLPALWRRLSFTRKVSMRNLFRYKKRFWMTVAGIGGCTALIVTGFGLRDSIFSIMDRQYDEIYRYTAQVGLVEDVTDDERLEITRELGRNGAVTAFLPCHQDSVTVSSPARSLDASLLSVSDTGLFSRFVSLRHRLGGKGVSLTGEGVVFTEKLASLLGVAPGDTVTLSGDTRVTATVLDVTEQYLLHHVYLTDRYYEVLFGQPPPVNFIMAEYTENTKEVCDAVARALIPLSGVTSVTRLSDTRGTFMKSMESVDYAVVVIIAAAAALAFVVLYSLTSINLTERRRELATLKVLGFYDGEAAAYLYRENLFLTAFGVLAGLVLGRLLHQWLILTVEIDMVMFGRVVSPASYAYAVVLTALFSLLVNVASRGKLKKIDMVESLKSME